MNTDLVYLLDVDNTLLDNDIDRIGDLLELDLASRLGAIQENP